MALILALSLFSCSELSGLLDDAGKGGNDGNGGNGGDIPALPACVGENLFKGKEFVNYDGFYPKFYRFDEEKNLVRYGYLDGYYQDDYKTQYIYEYSFNADKNLLYLRVNQMPNENGEFLTFEDQKSSIEKSFEESLLKSEEDLIWQLTVLGIDFDKDASLEDLVEIARKNKQKIIDYALTELVSYYSKSTIYTYKFEDDNQALIIQRYIPETVTSLKELYDLNLFGFLFVNNGENEVKINLWSDNLVVDDCYYDYVEITNDTIKGKISPASKPSKFEDEIEIKYVIEEEEEEYEGQGKQYTIILTFEGEETPVYIMESGVDRFNDNTENSTYGQPPKEKGSEK